MSEVGRRLLIAFAAGILLGVGFISLITATLLTTIDEPMKLVGQGSGAVLCVVAVYLLRYTMRGDNPNIGGEVT